MNKDAAVAFLKMVIAGDIRAAYAKYIDPQCRCHNPFFGDSAQELMVAMEENHKSFPNKTFEIQRAIEEGDLVAVHSRLRMGDKEMATVHIFRFARGRAVEFWDVGQPVPADSPNKRGMF